MDIALRRSPAEWIRVRKCRRLLAVQADCIGVAHHPDLEVIPLTRLEDRGAPIDLRVVTQANGDVVNRPGAVLVHAVRYALADVTARKFIDLDFEPRIHRDPGLIS